LQWVLKPENSLVWHKEVLGWCNKYAGIDNSGLAEQTSEVRIGVISGKWKDTWS